MEEYLRLREVAQARETRGLLQRAAPDFTSGTEPKTLKTKLAPDFGAVRGGVGKIFKLGKQAFNAHLQAFDNVVTPSESASWQLRFQIQLLFPKSESPT